MIKTLTNIELHKIDKSDETRSNDTSQKTDPEFYFSCHEKIITGDYLEDSKYEKQNPISDVYDPRET